MRLYKRYDPIVLYHKGMLSVKSKEKFFEKRDQRS